VLYTVGYVDHNGLLRIIGRWEAKSKEAAIQKSILHKLYKLIAWPS
jgi:hypothetical protein